MPLLPTMHEFVPMIESGRKLHTIRRERKIPFKVGQTLFLYTDSRTQAAKKQGEKTLSHKYWISIDPERLTASLEGVPLSMRQVRDLAWRDGFDQVTEFFKFFERYTKEVCEKDLRLLCWVFPSHLEEVINATS